MDHQVAVSVLFTDLVGSTALATRLGAADAERLRVAHFGLLGTAVQEHGGREVKNLGDGIMAVFPGTANAVEAAITMQQAVHRHNAADPDLPLDVRIGVATGDCVEQDGDYFGEPVVQAARLCAAADGGQILTTAVVGLLVPRGQFDFEDVGDLELKGLPEPTPGLAVRWAPAEAAQADDVPLQDRLVHGRPTNFVGREQERTLLRDAFKAARSSERQVVLVTGEAGLGKTSLVSGFAQEAAYAGATVLYGRCDEELAIPYRPWVEVVDHVATHAHDEVAGLDAATRRELARLVPSLHDPGDLAGQADADSPGEQYLLFRAVTTLLSSLAADAPLVVVLDDLHWADRPTLQLLRHAVAALPSVPLMLVATYRDTDLGADDALTDASTHLHREQGVHRLSLDGLSDLEVVSLLEATAGHELEGDGVSLAHALRTETAGNPFFVVEMLRHLTDSGVLQQRPDGRWIATVDVASVELPQSVRDLVRQRVGRLSDDALPTLRVAAVVGRDFDVGLVAQVLGEAEDDVLDVLERAMDAGLVAEVPGEADHFTFTHALVQHSLYQELTASRRARTHRRVAEAIEATVGDEPGDRVGELANHWLAAVRPVELDRVIEYSTQAARRALDSSAPDEAVRWYREALEVVEKGSPHRARLLQGLGEAERQAGHPTYRERLLEAADLAMQQGDDDVLIASALANHRGFHSASGEFDGDRADVLRAALDRAPDGDDGTRARLLATLAGEMTYGDDPVRFDMGDEALDLAARTDDAVARFDVIHRLGSYASVPDRLDSRRERARDALAITEALDDPFRRFFALEMGVDTAVAIGDMATARKLDAERMAIASALGQPILRWIATNGQALLDVEEGNVDVGEQKAGQALQLGMETGQPDAMVYYGALLIEIRLHQGRGPELIPIVQDRVDQSVGLPVFRAVLAMLYELDGRRDEAERVFTALKAEGLPFPLDVVWLTGNVLAGEVAAMLGDREVAATLYTRLAPYPRHVAQTRTNCQGVVAHYLGLLAACLGRTEDAIEHFATAQDANVGLRAPFHTARTDVALAEMLRDRQPERARQLAAGAKDLAQRHGMPTVEADADAVLSA